MHATHAKITMIGAMVVVGVVSVAAIVSLAGPLDPPAGPVAPSYKTLAEVEPRIAINSVNTPGTGTSLFRITQPGSYYLTGDITGVAGKHGIEIVSSHVTIDLRGFVLTGVSGSLSGIVSIEASIVVTNGVTRNWGEAGVSLTGNGAVASEIISRGNLTGFRIGRLSRVERCMAEANGEYGVVVSDKSSAIDCGASTNGAGGFSATGSATFERCTASENATDGYFVQYNAILTGCSGRANGGNGLLVAGAVTIQQCMFEDNAQNGIIANGNNGGGVIGTTATRYNGSNGIVVKSGYIVRSCSAYRNGDSSTGAGILALGADNRIEDNNCVGSSYGVKVDGAGNFIVRNSCSGNTTDWVFVANNVYGPIRDRRNPSSPAINGFDAAGSLGTAEPNANFSY